MLILRWKEKSSRPIIFEYIDSKEIVYIAYRESYINWNVYQKVIDRINTNKNGGWMFEKGNVKSEIINP